MNKYAVFKLAKIVASLQYQFLNTGRTHGDRKELVTFFVIEWLGLAVKVFDDSSNLWMNN